MSATFSDIYKNTIVRIGLALELLQWQSVQGQQGCAHERAQQPAGSYVRKYRKGAPERVESGAGGQEGHPAAQHRRRNQVECNPPLSIDQQDEEVGMVQAQQDENTHTPSNNNRSRGGLHSFREEQSPYYSLICMPMQYIHHTYS